MMCGNDNIVESVDMMKMCTKCGEEKESGEFYKQKACKDGLTFYCKVCSKKQVKEYGKTKEGLVTKIYSDQRSSSHHRNHPMPDYTQVELRKWALVQPVFHSLWQHWQSLGYQQRMTPSFDRLDDYKPYSLDNLQIMTWQKNLDKSYADRRNGINNKQSKGVLQINLDGTYEDEFISMNQASRVTSVQQGDISLCCNGKQKTAGGFIWQFCAWR